MLSSQPSLRPLFLARPTLIDDTGPEGLKSPGAGEITALMLETLIAPTEEPEAMLVRALAHVHRSLRLEFAAVYYVSPAQPERLTLCSAKGLPASFADRSRTISIWDFAEIADMPYNGNRPLSYGDFFSPVATAYGMQAGLIASLTHPQDGTVVGALLLGSRDPQRFDATEAAQASLVAHRLAALVTTDHPTLQHAA